MLQNPMAPNAETIISHLLEMDKNYSIAYLISVARYDYNDMSECIAWANRTYKQFIESVSENFVLNSDEELIHITEYKKSA